MDELTRAQRLDQMYYNEIALNDILGFFPTYMRPPFSDSLQTVWGKGYKLAEP